MIKSNLEKKILAWQAQNGRRLTLRELSEKTGLSVNFIHRFRHDDWQMIARDKLTALCAFFACTPDELLWDNSADPPSVDPDPADE
jgi:DNA-binding Xre family transcriptional regulator